ncbi:hypothetical protein HNR06_001748 [Nocardiopsis arvandica]|uniref:Uncharacterized protein n=1 Tax=Nocardiopsis sinuspersici TaxID=501010 RepID=A0A7Z0BK91_9ACTN|nr:hypothetical protein [Nocardiopsis sinuspersici]NYH52159.1 hypothetical protein [Nocardiopsis sinuspersici]
MTQRSEQLVLDYLSEVGLVLYGRMTAKERTAYLTSVRSRINARRAAAGRDDEDTVRGILRGLGSPHDLVEREVAGRDLDIEDDELIPPRPRHADRTPPPWRGGPSRGLLSLLEGPGQTDMRVGGRRADRAGRGDRGPGPLHGLAAVARHTPGEAAALLMLLATVPWWWNLSFLWVLGAALILLSQVWTAVDKWIGVGLPLVSCAAGMALWTGDARFVDQYVQDSLSATGVVGLGLASLACAAYLYPRALRSARAAEEPGEG